MSQSIKVADQEEKVAKYSSVNDRFKFQPVAVETSGMFGLLSMKFLEYVGSKITKNSDRRETVHLLQCIEHIGLVVRMSILDTKG